MEKIGSAAESNENVPDYTKLVGAFSEIGKMNQSFRSQVIAPLINRPWVDGALKVIMSRSSYDEVIAKKCDIYLKEAGIEFFPAQLQGTDENVAAFMRVGEFSGEYSEYLRIHVTPQNVETDQELRTMLEYFGVQVEEEIEAFAGSEEFKGMLIDRMLGVPDFSAEYKRLDPEKKFGFYNQGLRLDQLYGWHKDGYLKEGVLFKKNGFDIPVSKQLNRIGPWSWHEYTSGQDMANKWADYLLVLEKLKDAPELFEKALDWMRTALAYARQSYKKIERHDAEDVRNLHRQTFQDVERRLNELDFER